MTRAGRDDGAVGGRAGAGRTGACRAHTAMDDFLPPERRAPSHDQLDGRMTAWRQPLVLAGEMVTCAECGACATRSSSIHSRSDLVALPGGPPAAGDTPQHRPV